MIITVFGATGMVGKRIVAHALAKGFTVKAFGRNVTSLIDEDLRNENLEAIKGSVFDAGEVYNAVQGSDAVISALGGTFNGADKTRSLGIKTIAQQMEKAGVKRIVALGGMGVLNAPDGDYLLTKPGYPAEFLPVGREHLQAFLYLKDSPLQWTFVCPPTIQDAEPSGRFILAENEPPVPNANTINAGDLAAFMTDETVNNNYVGKRVGISAGLF